MTKIQKVEIDAICNHLDINKFNLITYIQFTINKFKDDDLYVEQNTEKELIINCLAIIIMIIK